MDILLTNDDGYSCVGFYPLLKELSKIFNVSAIAPSVQKSWVGKSISAHTIFEIKKEKVEGFEVSTINGTPADCVQVGLYHLFKKVPHFVISGINVGENVGHGRILSSGTVGAAFEAAIDGVQAIATSLYIPQETQKTIDFYDKKNYFIFENAAKITSKIAKILLDSKFDKSIDVLSINIPYKATLNSPIEITRPFKEPYGQLFFKKGNKFVHKNPTLEFNNLQDGSDLKALYEGKISITPISLDLVSKELAEKLNSEIHKKW